MSKKLTDTIKEEIRNLYVQGIDEDGSRVLFTLDALAKKYDIAQSTLYRHAQSEGWKVQQEQFQHDYLNELDESRQKMLVKESKKFDSDTLSVSKALLGQIGQFIAKAHASDSFSPTLINTIAEATIKIQRIGKLSLGESTENMSLNAKVQDTSAFRETMELLDEVAEQRREVGSKPVH